MNSDIFTPFSNFVFEKKIFWRSFISISDSQNGNICKRICKCIFFYYECPFRVSKWQKFSKANKFLVLHRKRFAISATHLSHIRDTDYVDEIWKSTHVLSIFTKLMILSRTLYVLMVLYCDFCICCFWYCCCHCCRCRRVRRSANGVVSCVHRFCFDFLYWIF